MKKMKKIGFLVLAFMVIVGLNACVSYYPVSQKENLIAFLTFF